VDCEFRTTGSCCLLLLGARGALPLPREATGGDESPPSTSRSKLGAAPPPLAAPVTSSCACSCSRKVNEPRFTTRHYTTRHTPRSTTRHCHTPTTSRRAIGYRGTASCTCRWCNPKATRTRSRPVSTRLAASSRQRHRAADNVGNARSRLRVTSTSALPTSYELILCGPCPYGFPEQVLPPKPKVVYVFTY
jgi:hypothetical protein